MNMERLKVLTEQMDTLYSSLWTDITLQITKSNQSAAIRARKASLKLEKLFKELRKESITLSQSQTNKQYL